MSIQWKRSSLLATLLIAAAASGCAQDVGDIDRTQPNRVKKSDLTVGTWWIGQKVTKVNSTAGEMAGFEGLMMELDKIVFVAEEDYLIAYKSYPSLPGSDDTSLNLSGSNSYEELYDENYKGSIRAMFPIQSHFDVQRQYDTSTGEQSNVILENTTDRHWYERDYIRVDWQSNPLVNLEWWFWYDMPPTFKLGLQQVAEVDPVRAPYFEYDENGTLVYFDAPGNYIIQPTIWDCLAGEIIGWWFGDCGSAETRIVTSFVRDLGDRNYEPVTYSNQDMNRFGYFRTERYTYDPQLGIMNAGRMELANRHNIWQESYKMEGGKRVAIPIKDRKVKTAPFYIRGLRNDDKVEAELAKAAISSIEEWNEAFKHAVRVMQGKEANAQVDDIFVACHVPVIASDSRLCGPVGYEIREGDFRKNVLWIVNQRLDAGLLGYGPGASDPLTGETLSAHSHVYLAAVNHQANAAVDYIKFYNGDLTPEGARTNDVAVARAKASGARLVDLSKLPDQARTAQLNSPQRRAEQERRDIQIQSKMANLRKFDYTSADAKLKAIHDSGLVNTDMDDAIQRSVAKRLGVKPSNLPAAAAEAASPFKQLSFKREQTAEAMKAAMGARGICFAEGMSDPNIASLAERFKGRYDYDNIFYEVRAEIFRATALHEMGHSLGLRHNFSGSFDSLNYFDEYWALRRGGENNVFNKDIKTVEDMYALYNYSDAQLKGGMLTNMYSSIMDYNPIVNDFSGLGKYDIAAIVYGYSMGTNVTNENETDCRGNNGSMVNGQCVRQTKGFVEVFTHPLSQLGKAGQIMTHKDTTGAISGKVFVDGAQKTIYSTFDDQTTVGQPYLELIHYQDFVRSFPEGVDFINDRQYILLDDYLADKARGSANRYVRVPYLFCTDDNARWLTSCRRWDAGADLFEQVRYSINQYETYYWFADFARGRAYWDSWYTSIRYAVRTFDELAHLFKQGAVANDRTALQAYKGHLSNDVRNTALYSIFNFLASVVSTPDYGLYCKSKQTGQLFGLSTSASREDTSEYYRRSICGSKDAEYFYVRQGQGRDRFGKYDVNSGFDYSEYDLEAAHLWTSFFALRAMFDNRLMMLRPSNGDAGTYLFGMYDYFPEELASLVNAVMADDFNYYSPRLDRSGNETETINGMVTRTGNLIYPPLVSTRFDGVELDPLTGQSIEEFYQHTRSVPQYGACRNSQQCLLLTGASEAYCGQIYREQIVRVCFSIFQSRPTNCPANTNPESIGGGEWVCLPRILVTDNIEEVFANLAAVPCSATNTAGVCQVGRTCKDGQCVASNTPIVESGSSLNQKQLFPIYAMLYTGPIGMNSSFYDQLNVWRVGSGETITPAAGFEVVKFENPYTGEVYAANKLNCSKRLPSGDMPMACNPNNNFIYDSGGSMLIEKANERLQAVNDAWDAFVAVWNTITDADIAQENEKYQLYMDLLYEWFMASNELEDSIRDINWIRSVYEFLGTLW
ncbi:MAG: zinc-dependent metalloprotease [Proteobacteria bacterium]|nr:zinc-dependent metalloprotease [Pseudomonadota bacterium]